ncbi:zinc finger BED domain-containing protein 1 [Elysia marginata]|uniref:Zinc finger BED domain-containing protein 1 n=1 Tax=Elysia marginata TaxID=1093978 RepID=A0AAV4GGE3_9GAST|nr:zinc finger BED domain-containing protein 1 [Elysia marginata]
MFLVQTTSKVEEASLNKTMSNPSKGGPKRPRSVVWYYFDKIPDEPYRARCKLCNATCHHANNTSNLFKHLRVKHQGSYKEAEELREQEMELYLELKAKAGKPVTRPIKRLKPLAASLETRPSRGRGRPRGSTNVNSSNNSTLNLKTELNSSLNSSGDGVKKSYYMTKMRERQNIGRAFLNMLAKDMEHPSIVNRPGFRDFVAALDNRFELPMKKNIMKTMIPELAEEIKHKVKLDVVIASYFSLSVECWKYRETQSYMTVSAHFIKDSWEMSSIVLETFDCTEERTETNTATNFKRITDEWGITDRVVALLSDSADEVVSSASLVNGWEELTCFGHILNEVMVGALDFVSELVRIQKKAAEAVSYFDLNMKASEMLSAVQQQHNLPVHRLKPERPQRFWTSTYSMFGRMVEQYEAVNTVLCYLGKDNMCLCDDEVELIRSILDVLKPFYAATRELCTESYTCMSKLIPISTLLQQVTEAEISSAPSTADSSLSTTATQTQVALRNALASQMQQHLATVENNYRLAAATLLDPRFKQHAFTDQTALEAAQQRLLCDVQAVVQSSETAANSGITSGGDSTTASFWGMFDKKVVDAGAMKTDVSEAENETRRFFKEANIPRTADPFQWWKLNEVQFPNLKVLAKKYLCVPATAVSSDRLFAKEGDEFARRRDTFRGSQLNNMIFLNKNVSH